MVAQEKQLLEAKKQAQSKLTGNRPSIKKLIILDHKTQHEKDHS